VASQHRNRPAASQFPEPDRLVFARSGALRICRANIHTDNRRSMVVEFGQQSACLRIPNPSDAIVTAGDHARAVRCETGVPNALVVFLKYDVLFAGRRVQHETETCRASFAAACQDPLLLGVDGQHADRFGDFRFPYARARRSVKQHDVLIAACGSKLVSSGTVCHRSLTPPVSQSVDLQAVKGCLGYLPDDCILIFATAQQPFAVRTELD